MTDAEIRARYAAAVESAPRAGDRYRHFKGGEYEIMGITIDDSTLVVRVAYRSLRDGVVWDRLLEHFRGTIPDGRPRFARI